MARNRRGRPKKSWKNYVNMMLVRIWRMPETERDGNWEWKDSFGCKKNSYQHCHNNHKKSNYE